MTSDTSPSPGISAAAPDTCPCTSYKCYTEEIKTKVVDTFGVLCALAKVIAVSNKATDLHIRVVIILSYRRQRYSLFE